MFEYLKELMEKLPEGKIAQLHSYVPLGAEKAVTVIVLSDSQSDCKFASESIQRAAQNDRDSELNSLKVGFPSMFRQPGAD